MDKLWSGTFQVASPTLDVHGELYVVAPESGEVCRFDTDNNQLVAVLDTHGQPSGLAVDPSNEVYVADASRQCIMKVETPEEGGEPQLIQFVDQFEGKPFTGPTRIAFNEAGELFMCDGGQLGDTSVVRRAGAVYRTVHGKQQLLPLVATGLACPMGLAVGRGANAPLFVAEMSMNRLLRFAQHPRGVYHCSVFFQFSGGLGPIDVALHPSGDIYVALFDFADEESKKPGRIAVISADGQLRRYIEIDGCEITGLCLTKDGGAAFVTEASNKCLYRVPL